MLHNQRLIWRDFWCKILILTIKEDILALRIFQSNIEIKIADRVSVWMCKEANAERNEGVV